LDPQLWQACAGNMVQIPVINSSVFYFPQGHSEHASENVDFSKCPRVSSYIPCRVSAVKFLADHDTDEVFAKIRLIPVDRSEFSFDDGESVSVMGSENQDKSSSSSSSFAKTLTQSDANNGGGFSVPRYCAETIFPRLDYTADPPVQSILARDVHGQVWKFRHIYRGTPRRHLLTTGWSTFVNSKNLVAGDSIVFMRGEAGDLCIGIRRAKKVFEARSGWNASSNNSGGIMGGVFSSLIRDDETAANNGSSRRRKVKAEDVVQAVTLAANRQAFEVVYYPRASTPEFCVNASLVRAAMTVRWVAGMRFKMAFETEDSSRISWFMGTITAVQVADPNRWPDSPWRLLVVNWDEPELLQNVKRVSPWLVELATTNVHGFPISSFSPPRKKVRLSSADSQDFSFHHHFVVPPPAHHRHHHHHQHHEMLSLSGNNATTIAPSGIQGARHGYSTTPVFKQYPSGAAVSQRGDESVSCLLRVGNHPDHPAAKPFLLFGQTILTDEQMMRSNDDDEDEKRGFDLNHRDRECEQQQRCEVLVESEDLVGRSLDLGSVGSYGELREKVEAAFGEANDGSSIVYSDENGAVRQLGDEPFIAFKRSARRLTILSGT
ncbi:hypothetical protein M569_00669, partial [Genlisea aurea]